MYCDPDLIINKEDYKSIESSAICSICSGIIINPVQCLECDNCFCKLCIDDWKKSKGENSCPFRCSKPKYKNSRLIKNILASLKFKCQNGCKIEIPYLEFEEHYKEKCPKIEINYKEKFFEYKKKYEDLLKKYTELEKKSNENMHTCGGSEENRNQNKNLEKGLNSKFHPHFLYNKTNEEDDEWICDLCKSEYNPKTEGRFQCEKCDFDICLKCVLLEQSGYPFKNIFKSKKDDHILNDRTSEEDNWVCNICKKNFEKKSKRFGCEKCDFDMCNDCKIKEELSENFNNLSIKYDKKI